MASNLEESPLQVSYSHCAYVEVDPGPLRDLMVRG